jgi:hypothetical protein
MPHPFSITSGSHARKIDLLEGSYEQDERFQGLFLATFLYSSLRI